MSKDAIKRILNKDLKEVHKMKLDDLGIHIEFNEDDMLKARAIIMGPKDTPYENGILYFIIEFPNNYPFSPPKIGYLSTSRYRIHPNLYVGKSSNNHYNRYLFFIRNHELYNTYLIDLYKFKIECKSFKSYLLNDHKEIYNKLSDKVSENSEDYFTSKISYSTWLESFELGDYFGILVNGNYKRNCLSGNEPVIFVKNLNQCIISNDDFIESNKFYFEKNEPFPWS